MAARRTNDWKEDMLLKEKLLEYVRQGIQRKEILDYLKRDFSFYSWSIATLDRRLRYFDIYYTDNDVTADELKAVVQQELDGPGQLLGYRALHKKIRQEHGLNVQRDFVYETMRELDPDGLERRQIGIKNKKKKDCFTTRGPNWVHSLDGHNKLMGFRNNVFPLAIYGSIDTASRKIMWLKIWTSNSDPRLIGRWYLEFLYQNKIMPSILRLDKGTETSILTTMHAFLRSHHKDMDPVETVIYGPSTSNQIERWWKDLHERLEKYYKKQLLTLKDEGHYNPDNDTHRLLLAFIMIPLLQEELDTFAHTIWNTHRIRQQKDQLLPHGVPNHMYDFPEEYGLEDCGWPVTDQQLQEAATHAGLLDVEDDYLDASFRERCEALLPKTERIEPKDCEAAFIYLKKNFNTTM